MTKPRGFAAMTPEARKAIAMLGGAAVPPEKRMFSRDKALAKAAGAAVPPEKRMFARDKALAKSAGAKGGKGKRLITITPVSGTIKSGDVVHYPDGSVGKIV